MIKRYGLLAALMLIVTISLPAVLQAGESEDVVMQRFKTFALEKVKCLDDNLRYCETNKQMLSATGEDGKPVWVSRFHQVSPESLKLRLKKVKDDAGAYVGIMKYARLTYECSNADKMAAAMGEHQLVKRMWQTEIVRYKNGQWK